MSYQFSEIHELKFQKLLTMFPDKRSLIIPALYFVQREIGNLTKEGVEFVAKRIGPPISEAQVYGVATFYTLFQKKSVGKHHIQVCTTSSCFLRGSDIVLDTLKNKLGILPEEKTKDGKYSVEEVECLGACGYAPMFQIGDHFYENLTPEKIERILDDLK